jgi:Sec-independent protein translocase protein TatA
MPKSIPPPPYNTTSRRTLRWVKAWERDWVPGADKFPEVVAPTYSELDTVDEFLEMVGEFEREVDEAEAREARENEKKRKEESRKRIRELRELQAQRERERAAQEARKVSLLFLSLLSFFY